MAEELQDFLERIHREGVKKAGDEGKKILDAARIDAQKIVDAAKKNAADIIEKAEGQAILVKTRAESAIRQSARDIGISLNSELQARLKNLVKKCAGDAMTPEFMANIIFEMAKNYIKNNQGKEPELDIILSRKDLENMENFLKGSLINDLKMNTDISLGRDFTSGLKIGCRGNDLFFDFSDDAIADLICSYINPKLAEIIKGTSKNSH